MGRGCGYFGRGWPAPARFPDARSIGTPLEVCSLGGVLISGSPQNVANAIPESVSRTIPINLAMIRARTTASGVKRERIGISNSVLRAVLQMHARAISHPVQGMALRQTLDAGAGELPTRSRPITAPRTCHADGAHDEGGFAYLGAVQARCDRARGWDLKWSAGRDLNSHRSPHRDRIYSPTQHHRRCRLPI